MRNWVKLSWTSYFVQWTNELKLRDDFFLAVLCQEGDCSSSSSHPVNLPRISVCIALVVPHSCNGNGNNLLGGS
jgi:hypothetical protein